jgi:hypothetical protein
LAPKPQIDVGDLKAAKSLAEAENWPVSGERGPKHTANGQRRRSMIQPTKTPSRRWTAWLPWICLFVLALGCRSQPEPAPPPPVDETPANVHVAYSGGGWRTHTAMTGYIMALLDKGGAERWSLEEAFSKVGTVSSNSGGTWFSTMLAYSDAFAMQIQAGDVGGWSSGGGWLDRQLALFDEADKTGSCGDDSGAEYIKCFVEYFSSSHDSEFYLYWHGVIENLVFEPFSMAEALATTPLSARADGSNGLPRWAKSKALLIAGSMLTDQVVLNATGSFTGTNQYNQICGGQTHPVMNRTTSGAKVETSYCAEVGSDKPAVPSYVTPVSFTSQVGGYQPLPLFLMEDRTFQAGFTQQLKDATALTTTIAAPAVATDTVLVLTAAATSSAAAGAAASYGVLDYNVQYHGFKPDPSAWDEAYYSNALSLRFNLSSLIYSQPGTSLSLRQLEEGPYVQIFDGGPTDNSGVAQLVRYLQLNGEDDGFHIVSFDNVTLPWTPAEGTHKTPVGINTAYLFGEGLGMNKKTTPPTNEFCSGQFCVGVPDLAIFDNAPLGNTAAAWSHRPPNVPAGATHAFYYTPYEVVTVSNPTFGITPGSHGTLHVFTTAWSDAATEPTNTQDPYTGLKPREAYPEMLTALYDALVSSGGLQYLQTAFGLPTQP